MEEENTSASPIINSQTQPVATPNQNLSDRGINPPLNNVPKRNLKLFVLLGIILFVVVFSLIGSYFFLIRMQQFQEKPGHVISPTAIPTQASVVSVENELEPPALYPDFEWEETENTTYEYYSLFDTTISEEIEYKPAGIEMIYKKNNIDDTDPIHSNRRNFMDYYGKELTKLGWDHHINYENIRISGLLADGVGTETVTYLKKSEDKMRAIIIESNTTYNGTETAEIPFSCPCAYEARVFVTDIFPISVLDSAIRE